MRKILSSWFVVSVMFVSVVILTVPQGAEAAWCYDDEEMQRVCFDDAQKDTCESDGRIFLKNTCYTVDGPPEKWDGTQSDFAVDESSAKTKKGVVACYTTGLGDEWCFPTMGACKATWGGDFISCKEKKVDILYCTRDSGLGDVSCSPSLQTCKTEGNCVRTDFRDKGLIGTLQGNEFNTTIKLDGRYKYVPLESTFISKENAQLPNFLQYVFNVGIAIVGIAALIMMTIGGLTYITSAGNNATAESAKKMIRDAAMGLLLAFFSWIILFTINPDLVGIGENLEKLTAVSDYVVKNNGGALAGGGQQGGGTTGGGQQGGGTTGGGQQGGGTTGGGQQSGGAQYDAAHKKREFHTQRVLESNDISVNKRACKSPSDTNCTDVGELPDKSINAIIGLKEACSQCDVVITGGSEGGHRSHGPGVNAFDLRSSDPKLTQYIKDHGEAQQPIAKFGRTNNAENWRITDGPLAGARVVHETDPEHYHIDWR